MSRNIMVWNKQPLPLSQKLSNRSVKTIKSQCEKVLITMRWHSDTVAYDI